MIMLILFNKILTADMSSFLTVFVTDAASFVWSVGEKYPLFL
jgi:hypothetical protein